MTLVLRPFARPSTLLAIFAILAGWPPAGLAAEQEPSAETSSPAADDYMVVDCLLPGRVRRLGGNHTFLTPRRPVRTTAKDCRIRGGEYTEFDRASYGSALKVWLGEAKTGDPEAQYYVGQIHEEGLGQEPDYEAAAHWYRMAAEQGYSPAELALGYLYETGLGVEQSSEEALLWYRRASDLPDDVVVMTESEQRELLDELDRREARIESLDREVEQLETDLRRSEEQARAELEARLRAVREEMVAERRARETTEERLARLLEGEGEEPSDSGATTTSVAPPDALSRLDYGPYVALVIANESYRELPRVTTAREDAEAVASLLEEEFGFEVRRVYDATRYQILTELNRLREELTERHNLLVYYSGRSERDPENQRSWWQPVDASAENRAKWLSSEIVTDHLDLISAQRVLLIADAAYAGALTRSGMTRLSQGMTSARREEVIRQMLDRRTRMVLESGGEHPIPLPDDASRSAFASGLVEALSEAREVTLATDLFRTLQSRALERDRAPVPRLALLRWARGEGGGNFFFAPR